MKKAIIVHRWSGSPSADWYPWLNEQLTSNGFIVMVPEMPSPDAPEIISWTEKLGEYINDEDEIYLIGHSVGCQTILRFIESNNVSVKKAIFVAPWFHLNNLETDEERAIAEPWLTVPIDFEAVKSKCDDFACLFSDNDPFVPLSDKDIFSAALDAKIITLHGRGHFTGEEGAVEIPEVLSEMTN